MVTNRLLAFDYSFSLACFDSGGADLLGRAGKAFVLAVKLMSLEVFLPSIFSMSG